MKVGDVTSFRHFPKSLMMQRKCLFVLTQISLISGGWEIVGALGGFAQRPPRWFAWNAALLNQVK
jgi:hypothetical protein